MGIPLHGGVKVESHEDVSRLRKILKLDFIKNDVSHTCLAPIRPYSSHPTSLYHLKATVPSSRLSETNDTPHEAIILRLIDIV